MGKKRNKRLMSGSRVKITGSCGVRDEKVEGDGPVDSVELKGHPGVVCSNNAHYVNDEGVPMVGVRLGERGQGGLVAVPRAALSDGRRRNLFQIAGDAWERIFGEAG